MYTGDVIDFHTNYSLLFYSGITCQTSCIIFIIAMWALNYWFTGNILDFSGFKIYFDNFKLDSNSQTINENFTESAQESTLIANLKKTSEIITRNPLFSKYSKNL